ncbi:MAG: hypothetical protein ACTSP0_08385 [Alphaproteobacteria bacterium]
MSAEKVSDDTPGKRRWPRIVILLFIYGGLLAGGHWGSGWLIGLVGVDLSSEAASHARHVVIAGIALYTALMAVPFVPGMEISLALLAAFGHQVAMFIYAATVTALVISYLIGRLVPVRLIASFLGSLGQYRAENLVRRLEPLNAKQRLETLIAHAPKRIVPTLLKHRYLAIAAALNVPGNAIIGGGGGIALLAGISGLFTFPRYLAIVSLAVLPVPLTILLMGS